MSQAIPLIKLYNGFASDKVTHIFGHVLKSMSDQREKPTRNPFKNAVEMYKRYKVKPDPNCEVVLNIYGKSFTVTPDHKGFFQFEVDGKPEGKIINYEVRLKDFDDVKRHGKLFHSNPPEIIISDVDDTVLVSHATSLAKKLYLLLTKNYESRKAFNGIREFYDHLCGHDEANKFFYVSSSEWNLYDFLKSFMDFNSLPRGVFLLQDIKSGIRDLFKSGGGSHMHKADKIKMLINSYPDSQFILVGDSGQKDPYIYKKIALEYPHKIKQIYIRDIRSSRREKVRNMVEELAGLDIKMEIFTHS